MNIIVPDCCTLLKWILQEADNLEQALKLQKDFLQKKIHILLPNFWTAELGNVLGLKYNSKADEYFLSFLAWQFEELNIDISLAEKAFEIMREFSKTSFYDAIYHAIAIKHDGVFVTADKNFYQKVKLKGSIILLEDYGK